jgi:hypothetical protein
VAATCESFAAKVVASAAYKNISKMDFEMLQSAMDFCIYPRTGGLEVQKNSRLQQSGRNSSATVSGQVIVVTQMRMQEQVNITLQ